MFVNNKCGGVILKYNECIMCTVKNCMHHAKDMNYCTLEKINVGTHEVNPKMCECTDCNSYKKAY